MVVKQTANKKETILIIGGHGSGKTTNAIKIMGNRPYKIIYADELDSFDIYSYPKKYGLIIEELEHKPNSSKVVEIINIKNVVLTTLDEKSVSKSIINKCRKVQLGNINQYQEQMTNAPNRDITSSMEMSMFDLTLSWLKNTNRDEVQQLMHYNKPAELQILSWLEPNVNEEVIPFVDSIKWKWNKKYFYDILSYGFEGSYKGRLKFNKRRTFSLIPKICEKLGLKYSDSYLIKSLIMNDEYKEYATSKLDSNECKILGIKKPRKKRESVRKLR